MTRIVGYVIALRDPLKAGEPEADQFEGALRCLADVASVEALTGDHASADIMAAHAIEMRVRMDVSRQLSKLAGDVTNFDSRNRLIS